MDLPEPLGLTGKLLVASPHLQRPSVTKSVVYIVGHDETGAAGFVINQVAPEANLEDLFVQLNLPIGPRISGCPLNLAGPLEPSVSVMIHTDCPYFKGAIELSPSLFISSSKTFIHEVPLDKYPEKFIVTTGYTQWEAGQLENEMKANDWLTCDVNKDILFMDDNAMKWYAFIKQLNTSGPVYSHRSGLC